MTVRLAHLADLHFGEDIPGLAERLAADIRAQAPDVVAISGDLSRRAAPRELAAAFAFLGTLGVPFVAVPGNHDIPAANLWDRMRHPLRLWHDAAPPSAPLHLGGVTIIGLDTVARGHWHDDWSAGAIGPRRRDELADVLRAAGACAIVVVGHHPLVHPPGRTRRRPPRGAGRTAMLLREAGVRALLCGHLHHAGVELLGTPWPVQLVAPSALSPRGGGAPNGWNLVEIGSAGLRATTRHFIGGTWAAHPLVSLA